MNLLDYLATHETLAIGQRLMLTGDEDHILVQAAAYRIAAINLENGNRWSNLVPVKNPGKITKDELQDILGIGEASEWRDWTVVK